MQDILTAISQQNEIDDIRTLVIAGAKMSGATCYSYHLTPRFQRQNSANVQMCSEGYPETWADLYSDPAFRKSDPMPDFVVSYGAPMTWSDAIAQIRAKPDTPPGTERFFEAMKDHGLVHGIGIPLYGPNCRDGYAAFCFDEEVDVNGEKVETLVRMMNTAHRRIVELLDDCEQANIGLSEREHEVLERMAEGCSNAEIALRLGISPETVGTYVKRLYEKLDTHDRIGATVKGLKLGLIYA